MKLPKTAGPRREWAPGHCAWNLVAWGADATVKLEEIPPGGAADRHLHGRSRQYFYVLKGSATLELGKDEVAMEAGDGCEVPPDVAHRIRNSATGPLHFLLVSCPAVADDDIHDE